MAPRIATCLAALVLAGCQGVSGPPKGASGPLTDRVAALTPKDHGT